MRSGVHGVEMLFVTMGTGCTHVSRTSAEDYDVCVGTWGDGRIGTFRGSRSTSNQRYGGQVITADGPVDIGNDDGGYEGCPEGLLGAALGMFKGGPPPVSAAETLEIYCFMTAAEESKARAGAAVSLAETAELAMEEAQAIVEENWHTPSMMKSAAEVGWTGANAPIVRELWGGV